MRLRSLLVQPIDAALAAPGAKRTAPTVPSQPGMGAHIPSLGPLQRHPSAGSSCDVGLSVMLAEAKREHKQVT